MKQTYQQQRYDSSTDWLELGDEVCVNFNHSMNTLSSRAVLKCIPFQVGGIWIFKDSHDGTIHYVTEGCTVTLLTPKAPE